MRFCILYRFLCLIAIITTFSACLSDSESENLTPRNFTQAVDNTSEAISDSSDDLSIEIAGPSSMKLSWNPIEGANSYAVVYSTESSLVSSGCPNSGESNVTRMSTTETFVEISVEPSMTYYARVCAEIDGSGLSSGLSISFTAPFEIPYDPANLSLEVKTATAIKLSWESSGGGTQGFRIVYKVGEEPPQNCKDGQSIETEETSIIVTGLTPDTNYAFRVCSYGGDPAIYSGGETLSGATPFPEVHSHKCDLNNLALTNSGYTYPTHASLRFLWKGPESAKYYYTQSANHYTAPPACNDDTVTRLTTFSSDNVSHGDRFYQTFEKQSVPLGSSYYPMRVRICAKYKGQYSTGRILKFWRTGNNTYGYVGHCQAE